MSVSILVVTNKKGGIDILKDNFDRQTFRDFEIVLVDELYDWRKDEVLEYLKDYKLTYIKPREKREGDAWNLNKAYNDGLNACKGSIIISLQDYIWIPANGIKRFVDMVQLVGDSFISGVGHKYSEPHILTQEGKISCFTSLTKPCGQLQEFDDRMLLAEGLQEAQTSYFELNWSVFPNKEELRFDEEMDTFYGCDNIYLEVVGKQLGYKSYIDRSNVCMGYNQTLFGRPSDWEERHFNKNGRFQRFLYSKGFRL